MGGEKLFVGGGPGDLLNTNADPRILALELRDELGDLLPFRAHRPEADLCFAGAFSLPAGSGQHSERDERRLTETVSPAAMLELPNATNDGTNDTNLLHAH